MIKNVIFDVDGTLIDSNKLHAAAWQKAFAKFERNLEFEDILSQIGKGGDQLMPVFLSRMEIVIFGDELEDYRKKIFEEEYLPKVKPFADVRQLFKRIKENDRKIVLASSAAEEELEEFKKIMNVEDLLNDETSSDDAESSKPEPDIFLAALRKLGNPPKDECIVVGDTPYDAEAGNKAGLEVIGLTCGGWSEDKLKNAGCIEVYESPTDLLLHLDESLIGKGEAKTAHKNY